jgi:hypothetical protein
VARANFWGDIAAYLESLPADAQTNNNKENQLEFGEELEERPIDSKELNKEVSEDDGSDPLISALVHVCRALSTDSNRLTGVLLRNGATSALFRSSAKLFVSSWVENSMNDLALVMGSYLPYPRHDFVNLAGECLYRVLLNGEEYSFAYNVKAENLPIIPREARHSYNHEYVLVTETVLVHDKKFSAKRGTRGGGGVVILLPMLENVQSHYALFLFYSSPNSAEETLALAVEAIRKQLPSLEEIETPNCSLF